MNKYQSGGEAQQKFDVDSFLTRLLDSNSPKITFTEQEIRDLFNACRHILVEQPTALELQAPVKVVGIIFYNQATFMANFQTYSISSRCQALPETLTIFSWEITLIVARCLSNVSSSF